MSATRTLVLIGVVVGGFSLRSATGSLAAVMDRVQSDLGMSPAVAGLLTALPVICFAAVGALTPRMARRHGPEWAMVAGLVAIVAGLAGRAAAPGAPTFLLGSLLALAGAAVGNVVVRPLVKRYFPDHLGPLSGLYAMSAAAGVGVPAALTLPLGDALGGWRGGLAAWAPVAVIGLLVWLPVLREARPEDVTPRTGPPLWRDRTALALTAYFGLQALGGYCVSGWLAVIYIDAGVAPHTAGIYLALTAILAVPFMLGMPVLAARGPGWTSGLMIGMWVTVCAGYAGLMVAPASHALVWALLLTAVHPGFSIAVVLIGLRSATPAATARLSAMVQSGGYALAAAGPFAMAVLRGTSGGWTVPLLLLVVTATLQLAVGLVAARPGTVDQSHPVHPAERASERAPAGR
ncbi:MFS transporter [Pseudonocardia sp.]|uniref:MFS transporter n=1 Tax=Pseudonocardia sp. TaxID=60912 RepID=UPI003D09C723